METILIILIFLAAVGFLGNKIYQSFNLKNKAGCAKGCGSCGAIDFEELAQKIEHKTTQIS